MKKLYAQLEVRKTKEMAANNPHLPKKCGSSRQGLGRSFMRYLAEFPEALTRQHSRDSGSLGHSSLPGSSRHRLLSSSLQEAEGPPALPESCSTYAHQREQDPPLLDSLLRRNLTKKAPRVESRELMEGPPALSYRSASAHNLMVGERIPRTRPTSLQKSLSVVAGSREKALLAASQAYLEETYLKAKEREERKKAEAAMMSPARRPSAWRLEPARKAPLSAPPSPAKSSSMDSSHLSGRLHEEAGRKLPHPPIRHQVSTPILALSGACLGEPRMLSPTSTLTPALMPPLAPTPTPALAPVPVSPQSPSLLTYICPWENEELPVKKENAAQEVPSGPERGSHSPVLATARLWRALSVAIEKRGAGEPEMNTEGGCLQGEANDVDGDRPQISKAHSLKTPVQQASMRSLGLAIKALTRSRSTYREKEDGKESPERDKDRAPVEGTGASPRSPRLGRPKTVSKQAALVPCGDEESLQNQQNDHTSRMLQVHHQEGSREQEDRGRRTSQCLGEEKVERTGEIGLATPRQVSEDKNAEQAKEAPVGWLELPKAGLHPLGSADHTVAEVCPWEVTESQTCQPDSNNMAEVCPWEVSEGAPEKKAAMQELGDSQEERGKAPEKPESKSVTVITRKKPERLVRGQEAVCPWESADPGGVSPQSVPQDSDRTRGRSEAMGSVEARKAEKDPGDTMAPEVCSPDTAKEELCPQKESEREGKMAQEVVALSQERQKAPKKAAFWREQKLGGDLESFCPWESTDFRGPLAVSLQAPESLGNGIAEVCPWEAEDSPANRKAEVCPWELGDELPGKEAPGQGAGGESLQEKKKALRKGSSGEMEEQTTKAVLTISPWQESVCPREGTAPVQSCPCLDNPSSKAGGQLPSDGNSSTMQLSPWEALKPEEKGTTPATAEICPWEVNETTEDRTLGHAPKEGESQKDKGKMLEKAGIQEVTVREKLEAVCPWESTDPGSSPLQPGAQDTERPQTILQRSGSVRSKAADICPWDTEETLTTEKTKICPWEVGARAGKERALEVGAIRKSPNDIGKLSADSGPKERAVTDSKKPQSPGLEVACPWESSGPGGSCQYSDTLDTDTPKVRLQELDHVGCRPAEVCPWEVEAAPTHAKANICPWEVNEGATGKGMEEEMGNESAGQREKTLEKERLTFPREGISKWETKHQEREVICPWEDEDLREPSAQVPKVSDLSSSTSCQVAQGHSLEVSDEATQKRDLRRDPRTGSPPKHMTHVKAQASRAEFTPEGGRTSNKLQSICPWESVVPAASFFQQDSQHPAQPRASSQSLVSAGSKVTEVCPWDAPDPDVYKPDSSSKAKICPWEVTEKIPEKGLWRQDRKGGSQEKGRAPEKTEPKGVTVQKTSEIADFGKQEAGESQDLGGLSSQSAPHACDRSKGSSESVGRVEARVAEVCPWEVEETPSAKKAEICPWEVGKKAAGEGGLEKGVSREPQGQGEVFLPKAESGGTEGHFSKTAAEPSREQLTVCPGKDTGSGEFFPQQDALDTNRPTVSPHGASSMGSRVAELCQWEVTDPEGNKIRGIMADICPWEETGAL